jgi:HD-GYP domain-containing protein (c-di-GMP phosphodiesterase class II)
MAAKLVPINADTLRIGDPLPFSLLDSEGKLLANKGYVIGSREDLKTLLGRGFSLFIDSSDSELYQRAYAGVLHKLVLKDTTLGEIAGVKFSGVSLDSGRAEPEDEDDAPADWLDFQAQAHSLLRETSSPTLLPRLRKLYRQLRRRAMSNPDGALFALFHLSATEIKMYSATHALMVSVICGLTAREILNWPEDEEETLCLAALTMNLGMTDLQDKLAQQISPVTAEQRKRIETHAELSVALLRKVGVRDPSWLEAVHAHHNVPPGPLLPRTLGLRMARLIQRADMFGARLAPRASRTPTAPAAAMQASYFDENRQVDEAGAALIKAVGIYSPGSFVKLQTDEIAIVVRRGANTTTPRVAVMVNREGMPVGEPIIRDTSLRDYRIVASVPHRDMKVQINLQRMLTLTTLV